MSKSFDLADDLPANAKHISDNDPLEVGERLLRNMLINLQQLKQPSTRPIEFRASGLPFCGIKRFLLDERGESYNMDHYTTTGTAIHETLQKWLPFGDYKAAIYGDWECSACGKVKASCTLPMKSCKCGADVPWKYKELSVTYRKLSGHIDLVLELNTTPVSYIIVDFKTTDMERKRSSASWDQSKPSSRNYVVQIRTYCSILCQEYGLNIRGWILASINRAAPIRDERDFHLLASGDWNPRHSKRWLKHIDNANMDFIRLKRLLRYLKQEDSDNANDALRALVKGRPCQSNEEYDKWMYYGFYNKDVCPMKKICCTGKHGPVLAHIKDELRRKK